MPERRGFSLLADKFYSGSRKPDNSLSYTLSKNEKQEMSESKATDIELVLEI